MVQEDCSGHRGPGSWVRVERRKNHAPNLKAAPGDPLPPGTLDLLSLYNLLRSLKYIPSMNTGHLWTL